MIMANCLGWYVTYDNEPNVRLKIDRYWDCGDSEVEAIRVYEYFKLIFRHVIMWHDGQIVHEYKYYDEGKEET